MYFGVELPKAQLAAATLNNNLQATSNRLRHHSNNWIVLCDASPNFIQDKFSKNVKTLKISSPHMDYLHHFDFRPVAK